MCHKIRYEKRCTYIFSEKVVLEGATRFEPNSLLGVFVGEEEPILCSRAQPLDLSQLLSEGGRRVHHRRLGRENMIADPSFSVNG